MDLGTHLAQLTGGWGLYLGTFLFSVVSGLVPVINCEVYLVFLGATAPRSALPALLLLASLGQMSAKAILYMAGRGVLSFPLRRYQARIDSLRERLARGNWTTDGIELPRASRSRSESIRAW